VRAKWIVLGTAAIFAALAVVQALRPFSVSGGSITDSSGATFVALTSSNSCGAPIVDAVRGSTQTWAVPVGLGGTGNGSIDDFQTGSVDDFQIAPPLRTHIPTCRSEARHRMGISGVFLLVALALVGLERLIGRRQRDLDS
jgi:hypothetical protein